MELNIFGYQIKKKKDAEVSKQLSSPVAPSNEEGALINNASSFYSMVLDLDANLKSENDLLRRYRETAMYPDVDAAIEDIVNEAISADEDEDAVELDLDDVKVGDGIKNKIEEEFDNITTLLRFNDRSHEIFRQWYIDGKMYYNTIIDPKTPKEGIKELRYVDPRKIRKVKNIIKEKTATGVEVVKTTEEYFLFSDKGVSDAQSAGVKMSLDSVVYVPSGNFDANTGLSLSFLHKAVKPTNMLKMAEDAMLIFRITRAPERRIFYIDTGNLPKIKAEQYVQDMMTKFKNKIVYDATTGEIKSDRQHTTLLEDLWIPRAGGNKTTEVTTLPGLQNQNSIDDIQYLQTKLFQALNVPLSRNTAGQPFNTGRSSEITRDEIKFSKFVSRLRRKFSLLFLELLKRQLLLKGIIAPDDWDKLSAQIKFKFARDNHFAEFKNNEIMQQRINLLTTIDPFVDKGYYSVPWVRKNVLMQTDEEIKEMDKQREADAMNSPPPQMPGIEAPQEPQQ